MHKNSIDANYQVMEVSFGRNLLRHNNKQARSNHAGNREYLICQGRSYKKCNNSKPPNWTSLCALLIPRFYASDWNENWGAAKHTNSLSKGPYRRIGLPRRTNTSFLVDKREKGLTVALVCQDGQTSASWWINAMHAWLAYLLRRGNGQCFAVSPIWIALFFDEIHSNECCLNF